MDMLVMKRTAARPSPVRQQAVIPMLPPAMSSLQRSRLLARIAAITCSSTWTSAVFTAAERARIDPSTASVRKGLRDRGIYPPTADAGQHDLPRRHPVRMRRCDACGRIVPPNNLAEHKLVRVCDDCRIEPESDDELLEKATRARTPGVRFRLLVGGVVSDLTCKRSARRQLRDFGLTDQEITVLAFLIEGYSSRRVAKFIERSQTFVLKLQRSAERKVRRSGISTTSLQFLTRNVPEERERAVDPSKLEAIGSWNV